MMDNLNLKPRSPDEVKTMMWTGENKREMFDMLTCGKKIDDYMTASGENFFIDHSTVKGGLVLITNIGNQCGCEIPVKIGDYVCGRRYGDKWCFSVADGAAFENNTCGTLEKREEKGKPIDVFKSQEQLEECLREWQHRLFLDGWLILAHVKDKIMNPDGEEVIDAAGYNTFVFESSQANIQLLSDETYKENNTLFKHCMEKDLVHELLHCKYDLIGCQGRTYEGVYLDATEHQKLEEMAKSLIMAKYGVDYNYFM